MYMLLLILSFALGSDICSAVSQERRPDVGSTAEASGVCGGDECLIAKTAEEITEQEEADAAGSALSLLQTSSHRRPQIRPSRCDLKFLHIPRNMGGSIEHFSLTEKVPILTYGVDIRHPNETGSGLPEAGWQGLMCIEVHTPPAFMPRPNHYGTGENVFCVTRNPYDRAISMYRAVVSEEVKNIVAEYPELSTDVSENCTKDALNQKWQLWLGHYKEGRRGTMIFGEFDCFLYPQHVMIYGPDGHQWCEHILPYDEMPGAFNELLNESGCDKQFIDDGRYDKHRGDQDTGEKACPDISVSDFTPETIAMLNEHYRGDFERFGYEMM